MYIFLSQCLFDILYRNINFTKKWQLHNFVLLKSTSNAIIVSLIKTCEKIKLISTLQILTSHNLFLCFGLSPLESIRLIMLFVNVCFLLLFSISVFANDLSSSVFRCKNDYWWCSHFFQNHFQIQIKRKIKIKIMILTLDRSWHNTRTTGKIIAIS